MHRLAFGLAGIEGKLLGLPITPAEGRVLLVAADRPKQAARSMWRMLPELESRHHGKLRETMLVWRGPMPFDLVKAPGELGSVLRRERRLTTNPPLRRAAACSPCLTAGWTARARGLGRLLRVRVAAKRVGQGPIELTALTLGSTGWPLRPVGGG